MSEATLPEEGLSHDELIHRSIEAKKAERALDPFVANTSSIEEPFRFRYGANADVATLLFVYQELEGARLVTEVLERMALRKHLYRTYRVRVGTTRRRFVHTP